jgi:hypothetical protein
MDLQVAGFGGTQCVVHAVAPGRIERHAIRWIGREQRRLVGPEQAGDVGRLRRIAA